MALLQTPYLCLAPDWREDAASVSETRGEWTDPAMVAKKWQP